MNNLNEDSVVSDFYSGNEEELNEVNEGNQENSQINLENIIYNQTIYNFDFVYNYFLTNFILKAEFNCPICNEKMKLINNNSFLDNKCFRCRNPKHDVKFSIRKDTFLENIRMNLIAIYFFIYDCFINNISANKAYIEYEKFKEIIPSGDVSLKNIQKLYRLIRNKIMISMHKSWENNPLGKEPTIDGVFRIEIDESKIVGNQNKVFWMFGIIDRFDKDCRVFCVKDNRTKETLLPLLRDNVYTVDDIKINNYNSKKEIHELCFSTRIYSDCFSSYQKPDFKEIGFVLHRVNHSIWFGKGLFHTNTIEGLWSQIKRIANDFAGITINLINNLESEGIDGKEYLDGWICNSLFFRECELKKLNKLSRITYLHIYLRF